MPAASAAILCNHCLSVVLVISIFDFEFVWDLLFGAWSFTPGGPFFLMAPGQCKPVLCRGRTKAAGFF
jgi:hypothetical protein